MRNFSLALLALVLTSPAFAQLPDAPLPQYNSQEKYNTVVHNEPSTFKSTKDGHAWIYTFTGLTAGAVAADIYDVHESELAYKRGAIEANSFLVCGDKLGVVCRPSASALYIRDLGVTYVLAAAPALVFHALRLKPLAWGALAAPGVFIVKHIQSGNKGEQY